MAIIETPEQPKKRGHGKPEMKIQAECVRWLHNEHPETRGLFWHIRNEIDRPDANAMLGARYLAEGLVRGVADCELAMARGPFHGLFVEFKTPTGRQSPAQVKWMNLIRAQGYRYEVARSLQEFQEIINEYLSV